MNGVEVADEDVFTVTYFDGAVETSRLTDAAVSDVKPVPRSLLARPRVDALPPVVRRAAE
ncbi:MAG: hypothetical protein ACLSVD_10685 [Eggerthellaceae bacterium]